MIVIDLIQKRENSFDYYYFLNNEITVDTFEGYPGEFEKHFYKLQNQLVVEMIQDFLSIERDIEHSSKEIHTYFEITENLKKFIGWAIENENMPEKVRKFVNSKVLNNLQLLLDLVPDDALEKKDLIFVQYCVTKNCNHRITAYNE
ncbi:MAG: hypothetical protein ACK5B9_05365 [Flavobacteriia bacterium]|jgi:hypothetical protein